MTKPEKLQLLWDEFSTDLKIFIKSKVKNDSASDDILQEVFLRIHNNINSLKDENKIKAWIYQITRNVIIDHFRAVNREQKESELLKELSYTPTSTRFMDEAITDMIKSMDQLAPEYCEALCLIELEGMSQTEYAEKKGLSYSGAKSRVQRARVMLKEMLLKCCHYQADKYGTVISIQPACCCCCNNEKTS
jgi:RNA polymerase sigma-70 factor, ECF subfamily